MVFSSGMAIFATLFAAFMWGSWFQSLNHLKGYPIAGFVLWLYTASMVLVWGVVAVLAPSQLPQGFAYYLQGKGDVVAFVLVCGAGLSTGMHLNLKIMGRVGMVVTTAISGAFGSIVGVVFTVVLAGGLPTNVSPGLVVLATAILIAASAICQYASVLRDRDNCVQQEKKQADIKTVLLLVLSSVLTYGYAAGFAGGTQSETNQRGLPPLLCVAFLCVGSFAGALITTSIDITRNRQWGQVLNRHIAKPVLLGAVSACCHYGGNILSVFATPVLSPAITFLLGRTSSMWTYFWGIAYKEFAGAKRKTIVMLVLGIATFVAGILLLTFGMYA